MKFIFDLFPVILFFIAFKVYGVFTATAVAMAATAAQIGWMWFRHRKVDTIMWVSLAVITLFGGATLLLQDEVFIKWKPTVIYWLLGIVLLTSSSFFKKNLIRTMLEKQVALPAVIWSKLNFSWAVFFIFMGCINLYVAFGYSLDTWVTFKLFGSTGLMLVFVVLQVVMLGRHMQDTNPTIAEETIPGDKIIESKIKD